MSATYRIEVEHRPGESDSLKWVWGVYRLSDGLHQKAGWATSGEEASRDARAWIAAQNAQQPSFVAYVDDDGLDANPEPHSVKA